MTTAVPTPTISSQSAATPTWYDQLSQQFGNTASGALSQVAGLGDNWYNQPLVAGLTPGQESLIGQGATTAGQWNPQFQAGMTQVQGATQWDPAKMQQHLSPYLGGVLDEIQRRGNLNLTENVMPSVNRSFTGSGLFGSTGNQDFLQRAMRENQATISGAQANAGLQAYNQAAQDYSNWGQLGMQGGTAQMQGALSGQQQAWTDLEKQYALQEQQRQNTQQGLTAGYEDWQKALTTPLNMMGALSKMTTEFPSLYRGANTVVNAPAGAGGSNSYADLLAILSAIGTGVNAAG